MRNYCAADDSIRSFSTEKAVEFLRSNVAVIVYLPADDVFIEFRDLVEDNMPREISPTDMLRAYGVPAWACSAVKTLRNAWIPIDLTRRGRAYRSNESAA